VLPEQTWPVLNQRAGNAHWPPENPREASSFIDAANRHGLLPLLFEQQSDLPEAVREALVSWRAMLRALQLRAAAQTQAIEKLSAVLSTIPFVLQKGSDYRFTLYPRPELRPMQDIDILLPTSLLEEAEELLTAGGIRRQQARGITERLPDHYERTYVLDEKILLEVHHRFAQPIRCRIDYAAMFSRAVPLQAVNARRLGDADSLIQHVFNMASDEFNSPLGRFVDLWLLLRARPSALEEATALAREWQVQRPLYGALSLASRIFPDIRIPPDLLTKRERRFLDERILPDPRLPHPEAGRARHLWQKFWLIDRAWRRAGFAAVHAIAVARGLLSRP